MIPKECKREAADGHLDAGGAKLAGDVGRARELVGLRRRAIASGGRPGYLAIFLIPTPDGTFLVTLLVLRSAQLGFAAIFLPRE